MHLSYFWIIPFILILLSIAIVPLINPHFWEHNLWWIAIFLFTIPMMIPLFFLLGPEIKHRAFEKILEYTSFILLLASLYVISGGIHISGTLNGNPTQNTFFLFTGSLIASIIGTTGASMLLIRPMIRANRNRDKKAYIIVFFIFLVSNVGGILTPLGDPPLFLGYLQGVPFEWTLNLIPEWAFAAGVLLILFYFIDRHFYAQESKEELNYKPNYKTEGLRSAKSELDSTLENFDLESMVAKKQVTPAFLKRLRETMAFASVEIEKHLEMIIKEAKEPIRFNGKENFFLLAGIVSSIYFQGFLVRKYPGIWPSFGPQEIAMVIFLLLSLYVTPIKSKIREENGFTFGPIKEVAFLFAAIFSTMVPALYILEHDGAKLGVTQGWQFFWASGILSSFLDNAPTYLTFLALGKALGLPNDLGFNLMDGGNVTKEILRAISCGSVFMGANSYIGNGPNFMVRSIAESQGVKMPSFFGYMAYSISILIPIFIIMTFIFFI